MNEINELTTQTPDLPANDLIFAKEMAETLHAAYPGHLWAVQVDGVQGVATIRHLALSGQYGYVLRLPLIYSMSQFKTKVLHAGGEMLERFKLARGRYNDDAVASLAIDHFGRTQGDYSTC